MVDQNMAPNISSAIFFLNKPRLATAEQF